MQNSAGNNNTAVGASALAANTQASNNSAMGNFALFNNNGANNTAIGNGALISNTSGVNNTALGFSAGSDATTGGGNVYIGSAVAGVAGESNHTFYIRNINTTNVSGGGTDTVTVNLATGLLGHATSSRRYKEHIKPIDDASESALPAQSRFLPL